MQQSVIMTENARIMKHAITQFALVAAALLAVSCSKDLITPEELFRDSSKEAKIIIQSKGNDIGSEDQVVMFRDKAVYRKSDQAGQSWFCAFSGGRMVYDMFMLSIYFDSIDKMKVGDMLKPTRVMFSFIASSDSNATTNTFTSDGKISLADKGDDYVILRFRKVVFNCSFGEYLIDGYLYCPLFDEYES